ncbi:MAG: hypothetical protein V3T40_05320 [Nitrososphaerales archaeon]
MYARLDLQLIVQTVIKDEHGIIIKECKDEGGSPLLTKFTLG